ncbi:nitroreductase family protein [Bacteroidota bacterium]
MDFLKTDLIQLGQMIRMRAYNLMMATRYNNPDLKKANLDLEELKECLLEWESRSFPDGTDKQWAYSVIDIFEKWKDHPIPIKKSLTVTRELPDLGSVMNLIQTRRSIRLWQKKNVDKDIIRTILEAGIYAPTAFNRMPWRFFVTEDPEYDKEPDLTNDSMVKNAPVKIYVGTDERLFFEQYSGPLDSALAMQNMMLASHAAGLGTCLVYQGEFSDKQMLKEKYKIPDHINIYCVILLGYPAEQPDTPVRMSIDEITEFIK